uniref:Uncharacterized protein n=1 Tax=Sus scrofa TaxID=9823 RepID=A0A8D1T2S1_PIG
RGKSGAGQTSPASNLAEIAQALRKTQDPCTQSRAAFQTVLPVSLSSKGAQAYTEYNVWVGRTIYSYFKRKLISNVVQIMLKRFLPLVYTQVRQLRQFSTMSGNDSGLFLSCTSTRTPKFSIVVPQQYQIQVASSTCAPTRRDTRFLYQREATVPASSGGISKGDYTVGAMIRQNPRTIFQSTLVKWSTGEVRFLTVVCSNVENQLLHVVQHEKRIAKSEIQKSLRSETSGKFQTWLRSCVGCSRNKS